MNVFRRFFAFCIASIYVLLPAFFAAQSPVFSEANAPYTALNKAVLEGTHTEGDILHLYERSAEHALTYTDWEKEAALAVSNFSLGMYYYYLQDEEKAGIAFDKGITSVQKSIEKNKNTYNTALYAALLLHNASVKKIGYQLKWVPKIKGIADSAIEMDAAKNFTNAYIVSYETLCFFPAPYGNYKEGIAKMTALLEGSLPKSAEHYFSIYSALGYAYSKTGNKKEAIHAYKTALTYFPHNPDAQRSLAALQK